MKSPIFFTPNDDAIKYFQTYLVGNEVRVPVSDVEDSQDLWERAQKLIFELEFTVKKKKFLVVSADVDIDTTGTFVLFTCKEI